MLKRPVLNFILFVLFVICVAPVDAQELNATKKAFEMAQQMTEENNDTIVTNKTLESKITTFDTALLKRMNEYNFMHQQRSFTWQYYSGIIIFILVVIIVAMGLALSYQQFKLNERLVTSQRSVKTQAAGEVATGNPSDVASVFTTNTMEIGKDGLKINTAVIGLIILSLSIAFFFLYLKYVYPITFVE